jgi:predicted Zn finger-like uncharacterized protein
MNIRCPQCQTVFRVNPERIPPKGVRARCARCGGTFTVVPPSKQPAASEAAPSQRPAAKPPAAAPSPASAPRASEPATATAERPSIPFGARDPSERAERLARALVSDIVAYHPERRDACLANGTLRTEFREEIMKSWEEYVAQVGDEMAKSTPYFRNALNAILAKGEDLF